MTRTRLTYCGNVHPAENLPDWISAVERFAVPVAAAQPQPFGLGTWWNAALARELAEQESARESVRELLARTDLTIWTLNVFPHGDFHGDKVKEAVYSPSWAEPERLRFTLDAARAVAALVPEGSSVPLSTLPIGYGVVDLERAATNLADCARQLAELEDISGVRCNVALEPEPFCLIETVSGAAEFLEERVFTAPDEELLRRHLGVCIDLCHLAVVGEDPIGALSDLEARGVEVPKIQVSSCLELRETSSLDLLLAFDEPRYLHQTVSDSGLRALDLPDVRARADEFLGEKRIRTHFHMPIFWDDEVLGSTRSEVERVLTALRPPYPLLEVETYTWNVLDREKVGATDLVGGLCEELAFARSQLRE